MLGVHLSTLFNRQKGYGTPERNFASATRGPFRMCMQVRLDPTFYMAGYLEMIPYQQLSFQDHILPKSNLRLSIFSTSKYRIVTTPSCATNEVQLCRSGGRGARVVLLVLLRLRVAKRKEAPKRKKDDRAVRGRLTHFTPSSIVDYSVLL